LIKKTIAARGNQAETIELLFENGANTEVVNKIGRFPIHEAVGSVECIKTLISLGADVNCSKRGEWTVLMCAGISFFVFNYFNHLFIFFFPSLFKFTKEILKLYKCLLMQMLKLT